ncbi:hypothetical protein CPB84DRAFT_1846433 [Gymnopilus junonius]|uniref:Uncharacterized protein n=1 Tax=Gymnopilus junonius TaxID=109634 RepID=A0A9P5TNY5_GYMJU|nr:hypothetical protein CPB84DRAFT_1846433 [Gymnopilus junonius]
MPRQPAQRNAILKSPVETISYQDNNGASRSFYIYEEVGTNTELVMCDLCRLFFMLKQASAQMRSPASLRRHRGKKVAIGVAGFGEPASIAMQQGASLSSQIFPSAVAQWDKTPDARQHASSALDLTPRASRVNLRSSDTNDQQGILDLERLDASNFDLSELPHIEPKNQMGDKDVNPLDDPDFDTELEDPENAEEQKGRCQGQPVQWIAGSLWETYAWQQHDSEDITWKPIGFSEDSKWITLRSKLCRIFLEMPVNLESLICDACNALLSSKQLRRFMSHATTDNAIPGTPYVYRNFRQLKMALITYEKKNNAMKLQIMNYKRKISQFEKRLNDYKRMCYDVDDRT